MYKTNRVKARLSRYCLQPTDNSGAVHLNEADGRRLVGRYGARHGPEQVTYENLYAMKRLEPSGEVGGRAGNQPGNRGDDADESKG